MPEDRKGRGSIFNTVSMAEILLSQNLVQETQKVIADLKDKNKSDPTIVTLEKRVESLSQTTEPIARPQPARGFDRIDISCAKRVLTIEFELTEHSLLGAKKVARYSGYEIIRLFTASPGPRGVRTNTRDIKIPSHAAVLEIRGLPFKAVHVAAIGFLAHTGFFVPVARSSPLVIEK